MGEFELLARLRERLPPPGPRLRVGMGDDAAVSVPGGAVAVSVDAIVDGVHFRREQATPAQIGHKALATALSDLAAMGAESGEAYVTLGVPPDLDEAGCLELLDGLLALASRTGTSLAGGDVTRSGELFLATTVVGHAPTPEQLVTRSGAQPGDVLVLTGEIGGAAAGLLAMEHAEAAAALPATTTERLRARQLEPQPRLAAGRALAESGATAMIDLSDGLGGDAAHLAEASGVRLAIDADAAPLADGVTQLAAATGNGLWDLALAGGEDYELLAALPAERLEKATAAVYEAEGIGLTRVGEVEAGEGVEIRPRGGEPIEPKGFDQLA
ncbi:MAG TPA: thiamine-phosphate kinase [Solirubrobacterales bacterium]